MHFKRKAFWFTALVVTIAAMTAAQEQPVTVARAVGAIKAIDGYKLTLATDGSGEISVAVEAVTRIVRVAPGQKDLKGATPVKFQELQTGDRILVRGAASADGNTITAASIVLMKASDVAQKQERERQDWEKRGVGGLVTAVDPTAGTVQIKTTGFGGSKTLTVRTSKETIVRRYKDDSAKFDDAVLGTLDQVKSGDQLRARGNRNADGSEVTAEEIVSGTFRNISGLVVASDPAANTITVNDLATKKPVVVKVTTDSQLHKMPEMLAQGIAMMLQRRDMEAAAGEHPAAPRPAQFNGRANGMRGGDMNQMLSRMPKVTVPEIQKGDAVMIVSTAQQGTAPVTAITLVSGVQAILTASPNDPRTAALLSPWSLGGGGGGEAGPPQ